MHNYCRNEKAQISMEFLVILLATVVILLVFMPVFSKLEKSTLFAVDVYNASNSLSDLKTGVLLLDTLAEGSTFEIDFSFVKPVHFSCFGNLAEIDISTKIDVNNDAKTKTLDENLALSCNPDFDEEVKSENYLVRKINAKEIEFEELN